MRIQNLTSHGIASNCYLVSEGDTAILIDASADATRVLDALKESQTTLRAVLLTHGHFDHLLNAADIRAATGAPLYLCERDADFPADPVKNASLHAFDIAYTYPEADRLLKDGDTLTFGALTVRVWNTPGHTPGSLCFFVGDTALFTGDTLFSDGWGRTDLYGGDETQIIASLQRLSGLPRTHRIYPGHGHSAVLGEIFHRR